MANPTLKIVPVDSRQLWKEFFDLRRRVYSDDPNVVYPMRFMERKMLDAERHPFYQHARRQAFMAYRNGAAVGRIVAIKDDLHNEHYDDRVGFFGFFESIDDAQVAALLFEVAGEWLHNQGCDCARGPVNPSMKSDFGIQVKGHGDPPFVMMGYSPPYYESLVLDSGFAVIREFNAYLYDVASTYDEARAVANSQIGTRDRIFKRYPKLRIRGVEAKNMEKTLREINELGNTVRKSGWGFVPLTEAELVFMIKQLKQVLVPETILAAYWDDRLVGYCVNVPDINWALRKTIGKADWIRLPQFLYWLKRTERTRVIALGADPEFRNRGVGILLSTEMRQRGLDCRNYHQWEFSWIDTENKASIKATGRTMPMEHYKTYRLYQKSI